jgi:hypothetical protein
MEADWGIEIGGGAPVIEALWVGFVDLRRSPERIGEIAEAAQFPALANLLRALNGAASPLWTAKCDLWEPETADLTLGETANHPSVGHEPTNQVETSQDPITPERANPPAPPTALACYIDLLPLEGVVFADWKQAESFCRDWIARLDQLQSIPAGSPSLLLPNDVLNLVPRLDLELRLELIVRQAVAGSAEGFGVTAYLCAVDQTGTGGRSAIAEALGSAMVAFAAAIPPRANAFENPLNHCCYMPRPV